MPITPASIRDRKPPPDAPPEGRFRVTIRIDRPDGQFVTSVREIPADLFSDPGDARPAVYVLEIQRGFLDACRRAAELAE